MAKGRRCDVGCETWPDDDRYKVCPVCNEKTTRYKNVKPVTTEEAAYLAFDAFYAEWDKAAPSGRLDPSAPNAAGRFAPCSTCSPEGS